MVGAGGLAHAALAQIFSARSLAVPLKITIIDYDHVELSNLNRQIFFDDADIGKPKAECLATKLHASDVAAAGHTGRIQLAEIHAKLDENNIAEIFANQDFIIDATDSVRTKLLINDYCCKNAIPFCYAGLSGDEGLVLPVFPAPDTPCLRCIFPEFDDNAVNTQELTCQAQGVVGAHVGVVGATQGKIFLNWIGGINTSQLLSFSFNPIRCKILTPQRNPECQMHQHRVNTKGIPHYLDLTQERCPKTFLFTKLALEKLSNDETLQVRFGAAESATNVKRSCESEGHRCSEILPINDTAASAAGCFELQITKLAAGPKRAGNTG